MGEILGSGGGESVRRRDFASLNRFALPASVKSGKAGHFRRPVPSSKKGKSDAGVRQLPDVQNTPEIAIFRL
jgi:hypothetical protein